MPFRAIYSNFIGFSVLRAYRVAWATGVARLKFRRGKNEVVAYNKLVMRGAAPPLKKYDLQGKTALLERFESKLYYLL